MRNEKSEVGNEDCECSLPISHMACTDILGDIELDPEKWEMRLKRESPSLKFPPQNGGTHRRKRSNRPLPGLGKSSSFEELSSF